MTGGNLFDDSDDAEEKQKPTVKKPSMASLMTGAELAKQQSASSAERLDPEACEVGLEVEHVEYGLGKIIAMTGSGRKVTATINFPKVGNKRIRLVFSNLRLPSS